MKIGFCGTMSVGKTTLVKCFIDENFPDYILKNKEKFKDWII